MSMKDILKQDFFGIDQQIDDLMEIAEPWVMMPNCYHRPLIVCLWGMTGTGKTTLIRKIARELDIPLVEMDLGMFCGDDVANFSANLFSKYYELSGKPCIFLLDEFHLMRTMDENGAEISRYKLRGFWSLISDGKVVIDDRDDLFSDFENFCDRTIEDYNDYQRRIRDAKAKNSAEGTKEADSLQKECSRWCFPRYMRNFICRHIGASLKELNTKLSEDFVSGIDYLRQFGADGSFQPVLDFTKSLIVISGNLDTVYPSISNFDPDIDLDNAVSISRDITVADVKHELSKRFRPEQIGRLGNNHIIYPFLGADAYKKIIRHEIDKIHTSLDSLTKHGFIVGYDDSVVDLIYREGVVPAQGARSVLSIIGTMYESVLVNFAIAYCAKHSPPTRKTRTGVKVTFDVASRNFSFFVRKNGFTFKKAVRLKVDDLRVPRKTDKSVVCATHEAGHVVMSVIAGGLIPNRATAYAISPEYDGIVEYFHNSKSNTGNVKDQLDRIMVALGGLAAERIMFGEDRESYGVASDMGKATVIACHLVDVLGYRRGGSVGVTTKSVDANGADNKMARTSNFDEIVSKTLAELMAETVQRLRKHESFLIDMANELVSRSCLNRFDIEAVMKRNGIVAASQFSFVEKFDERLAMSKLDKEAMT